MQTHLLQFRLSPEFFVGYQKFSHFTVMLLFLFLSWFFHPCHPTHDKLHASNQIKSICHKTFPRIISRRLPSCPLPLDSMRPYIRGRLSSVGGYTVFVLTSEDSKCDFHIYT